MRLLVCGGRELGDEVLVTSWLDFLHRQVQVDILIHGAATGADTIADVWAKRNLITVEDYPVTKAEWTVHGRAAGPIRNRKMYWGSKPDLVLAFPGGKGTADMVEVARGGGTVVLSVHERI